MAVTYGVKRTELQLDSNIIFHTSKIVVLLQYLPNSLSRQPKLQYR